MSANAQRARQRLTNHVCAGLSTTGHIRSLAIFNVYVIFTVFLLSKYSDSMKVLNQSIFSSNLITVREFRQNKIDHVADLDLTLMEMGKLYSINFKALCLCTLVMIVHVISYGLFYIGNCCILCIICSV